MRDLVVSLIILGLFPACFRRPFIGLLVFSWLAYMRVQDLTWGFARGQRWSFYVAIITFVGFVFGGKDKFFRSDPRCWLMVTLIILVGVGVLVSENASPRQAARYLEFVKIVGIALFTTSIVKTREQLRILLWVIALSLGFYGVKSGIWGIMSLGRVSIDRGPGGMLRDNNDFSLALCMALPMLWHIGMSEKREVLRRAFLAAVPLTFITILLTHSRGGMLALTCTITAMVWRSRNRVGGFAVMFLVGILAIMLAPADLKERAASIGDYQNDSSANARLRAWKVAVRMAVDNPLFGVGFEEFRANYLRYEPNPDPQMLHGEGIFVAHNSYLQIWAEAGTLALVCYLALIGMTLATIWRIRRQARQRYYSSWIINYSVMFEASMVAFMVGAVFLNRAHFDLFYHWVAIVLVFGKVAEEEMADETHYPVRQVGTRGSIRSVGRSGFDRHSPVRRFRNTPLVGGGA